MNTKDSIVPRAMAILAEEAQSLASAGVSALSTLPMSGAAGGLPVGDLPDRGRALADMFVEMLQQRPEQVAQLLVPGGRYSSGGEDGNAQVLRLKVPLPVTAGDVACVLLRVANDDTETDDCALVSTDLIGTSGHRIPAAHVRVSPNPARIPGGTVADLQIEVRIPSGTPAGAYTGLVQTDDGESVRALVEVTVGGEDSRSNDVFRGKF